MKGHLRTPAEAVARLDWCIKAVGSRQAFAAAHGVTDDYLRRVLNGTKPMTAELAATCGMEQLTLYRLVKP